MEGPCNAGSAMDFSVNRNVRLFSPKENFLVRIKCYTVMDDVLFVQIERYMTRMVVIVHSHSLIFFFFFSLLCIYIYLTTGATLMHERLFFFPLLE